MDSAELLARPPRVLLANGYPFRPGQEIAAFRANSVHLIAVKRGRGVITIDGRAWPVEQAGILVVPWSAPVAFHAARRDPMAIVSLHLRFLAWDARRLDALQCRPLTAQPRPFPPPAEGAPPQLGCGLVHADAGHHLADLAADAAGAWKARERDPAGAEVRCRAHALALLAGLEAGAPTAPGGRLAHLLDWIRFNYPRPCSVRELALRAGLGLSAFNTAFRAATGRSPMAYIIDLRLAQARVLLAQGGAGVAAVGVQVGIPDPRQFRRLFRRRFGLPPTAWRLGGRDGPPVRSTPMPGPPVAP